MEHFVLRYISAAELLPARLKNAALALDEVKQSCAEEFRLRAGQRMSVLLPQGEVSTDTPPVTAEDITEVASRAARGSLHSVSDELSAGFITASGGHRLGLCGRAVMENGCCRLIRDFSSANLRIAKEVIGAADNVFPEVYGARLRSTLIISPPGGGKTTLLRDLVRRVGNAGCRVSVVDERGELCAYSGGHFGFDIGRCVDVMTGAPKAYAALAMLRSMDPQVIALDEITDPADYDAVLRVARCGVTIFATMHASSPKDVLCRSGISDVLPIFEKMVVIEHSCGHRTATVLSPSSAA